MMTYKSPMQLYRGDADDTPELRFSLEEVDKCAYQINLNPKPLKITSRKVIKNRTKNKMASKSRKANR